MWIKDIYAYTETAKQVNAQVWYSERYTQKHTASSMGEDREVSGLGTGNDQKCYGEDAKASVQWLRLLISNMVATGNSTTGNTFTSTNTSIGDTSANSSK